MMEPKSGVRRDERRSSSTGQPMEDTMKRTCFTTFCIIALMNAAACDLGATTSVGGADAGGAGTGGGPATTTGIGGTGSGRGAPMVAGECKVTYSNVGATSANTKDFEDSGTPSCMSGNGWAVFSLYDRVEGSERIIHLELSQSAAVGPVEDFTVTHLEHQTLDSWTNSSGTFEFDSVDGNAYAFRLSDADMQPKALGATGTFTMNITCECGVLNPPPADSTTVAGGDLCGGAKYVGSCKYADGSCDDYFEPNSNENLQKHLCGSGKYSNTPCDTSKSAGGCEVPNCSVHWYPPSLPDPQSGCPGTFHES